MSTSLFSIIDLIEEKYERVTPEGTESNGKLCIQGKLEIEGDNTVNIDKINSMEYLYELGDPLNKEELDYVESKIIKFITTDPDDLADCLDIYNISQELICGNDGISKDSLLILANIINLKSDVSIQDDFNENMIVVENRLGKYVPDIIKNIIDISETYEKNNCTSVSETTKIMKRLYSKVINKHIANKDYEMPDINIGGFFESFQANIFTKIIFLIFIAYILGKIINLFNVKYNINSNK